MSFPWYLDSQNILLLDYLHYIEILIRIPLIQMILVLLGFLLTHLLSEKICTIVFFPFLLFFALTTMSCSAFLYNPLFFFANLYHLLLFLFIYFKSCLAYLRFCLALLFRILGKPPLLGSSTLCRKRSHYFLPFLFLCFALHLFGDLFLHLLFLALFFECQSFFLVEDPCLLQGLKSTVDCGQLDTGKRC